MSTLSYTHWAYFPDEQSARACAREMADYVTRVRPPWEHCPDWLFLAGRDVELDDLVERHNEVEAIVVRHGGKYDGGEATYSPDGQSVPDPMLRDD